MKTVIQLVLGLCAGAFLGFFLGRDQQAETGEKRSPSQTHSSADEGGPAPTAEIQSANQRLAGGALYDRYEAVLALLEQADSHDEMFRLFESSLPNVQLRYLIAEHWALMDAPGMFERLMQEGVGNFAYNGRALFKIWARNDPQAALDAIARLGNTYMAKSDEFRKYALAGWFEGDPAGALRSGMDSIFHRIPEATQWIDADPEAAYQILLDAPDSHNRQEGLAHAIALLAQSDPLAALERSRQLEGTARTAAIGAAAVEWARQDLEAAMGWVDENLFGKQRSDVLLNLYQERIGEDPETGLELLEEVTSQDLRRILARQIAGQWSRQDPRAALEWAAGEDSGLRHGIQQTWVTNDTEGIAAWIIEHGGSSETADDRIVSSVVSSLARQDPADAIDWAMQLPDYRRGGALERMVMSIGYRAVPLLREQLPNVPAGRGRNSLLTVMGSFFMREDPEGAEAWIGTLGEEDQAAARIRIRWE